MESVQHDHAALYHADNLPARIAHSIDEILRFFIASLRAGIIFPAWVPFFQQAAFLQLLLRMAEQVPICIRQVKIRPFPQQQI